MPEYTKNVIHSPSGEWASPQAIPLLSRVWAPELCSGNEQPTQFLDSQGTYIHPWKFIIPASLQKSGKDIMYIGEVCIVTLGAQRQVRHSHPHTQKE